jgi:hypothetical protein
VVFCTILFLWLDLSIASIHIPISPTCMRECFFIEPLIDSDVGSSRPGAYHLHIPLPTKFTQTISREYWMIYRGPGFLAVVYNSAPHPPLSPLSSPSLFLSLPVCRRSSLLTEWGGRGGRGAKSYDLEKAWPSINHSILSGNISSFHRIELRDWEE